MGIVIFVAAALFVVHVDAVEPSNPDALIFEILEEYDHDQEIASTDN